MMENKELKLYTDGGSRSNPGESACAYVICKPDGSVVEKTGFYLGPSTNNQAEYQGLKRGLERVGALAAQKLTVYMDSELIIKQMNGLYKVKHKDLLPLFNEVKKLAESISKIEFIYIPRSLNKDADREVNRILDEHQSP